MSCFVTPWIAACKAFLSFTSSWSLLKFMSVKSVMLPNHLILCHPILLLPSTFPRIRVFSNESVLHIRWTNYWTFSFRSAPPMNIQDWFPLGLTGLTSLQSKWLSRVFSNTTVQKHPFFGAHLYGPNLTSIHYYWKNYSFDQMDTFWQSNVSAFEYAI